MKNTNYLKLIFAVAVIFTITGFVRTDTSDSPKDPSSIEMVNGVEIILGEIPTNLEFSTIYLKVDKTISGLNQNGYVTIPITNKSEKYLDMESVLGKLGVSITLSSSFLECGPWSVDTDSEDPDNPTAVRSCCTFSGPGYICWTETCECGYCCG